MTKIEKIVGWKNRVYKLMTVFAVVSGLLIVSMEIIGAIQWLRLGYAGTVSWWQTVSWGPIFRVTSLVACTGTLIFFGTECALCELEDRAWAKYEAGD